MQLFIVSRTTISYHSDVKVTLKRAGSGVVNANIRGHPANYQRVVGPHVIAVQHMGKICIQKGIVTRLGDHRVFSGRRKLRANFNAWGSDKAMVGTLSSYVY